MRIITKFLPLNVKAVLESKCPKYQSVMTFGDASSTINTIKNKKDEEGLKIGFLKNGNSTKPTNPVIVPTAVKKVATKKIAGKNAENKDKIQETNILKSKEETAPVLPSFEDVEITNIESVEPSFASEEKSETIMTEKVKRGRGRPKKVVVKTENEDVSAPKRGRGRPRKTPVDVENNLLEVEGKVDTLPGFNELDTKDDILPGFKDIEETESVLPGFDDIEETESVLPGFDDIEETESVLPGFDDIEETESVLPGFDNIDETEELLPGFDSIDESEELLPGFDVPKSVPKINDTEFKANKGINSNNALSSYQDTPKVSKVNIPALLSKDKKVVAFVGTTKNGTSFLVNNLGKALSTMGIKTAILDLTTNRNSYYIYTKNEEQLRNIAFESIKKLRSGITSGIVVDKYLDVYTALPGDRLPLEDVNGIMSTLAQNYSVVLIDCDFNTPSEYFDVAQEIYIVQTMDILTIQPMTAFLRDLKAKDILKPEKIRIVINKELRVRGLTPKAIIGGLAFYNDPAMSFMTELFNKDTVKYCTIPFEEDIYAKYLEGVMDCEITISGYSKNFNIKLKELANMVYPLLGNKYRPVGEYSSNYKFSEGMNNTLEQMKKKY